MAILIGLMVTAIGVALLNKALKGKIWPQMNSMKRGSASKDQIIEIEEYEILDEVKNRASDGYRVKIQD